MRAHLRADFQGRRWLAARRTRYPSSAVLSRAQGRLLFVLYEVKDTQRLTLSWCTALCPQNPSLKTRMPTATPMVQMMVTVPDGVMSGQQMQVNGPNGQAMVVTVPEGVAGGQKARATTRALHRTSPASSIRHADWHSPNSRPTTRCACRRPLVRCSQRCPPC